MDITEGLKVTFDTSHGDLVVHRHNAQLTSYSGEAVFELQEAHLAHYDRIVRATIEIDDEKAPELLMGRADVISVQGGAGWEEVIT